VRLILYFILLKHKRFDSKLLQVVLCTQQIFIGQKLTLDPVTEFVTCVKVVTLFVTPIPQVNPIAG
jgi:hypothetical protein